MEFEVEKKLLNGLYVIVPQVFEDERGFFSEVYRKDKFRKIGLIEEFVQDNHSGSIKGVLRGLHFQWDPPMGKLMRVSRGEAYLVAVDIRKKSPTLGQWHGETVSEKNKKQIWTPAGFARGFYVLSDYVEIQYKCTGVYNSQAESGILWNDPEIGIEWPIQKEELILSEKDQKAQTLLEWLSEERSNNFKYKK